MAGIPILILVFIQFGAVGTLSKSLTAIAAFYYIRDACFISRDPSSPYSR